jgi:hypothetical protein
VSTSFHHGGFSGPSPSGVDSSDVFTKRVLTASTIDARYASVPGHEFFGSTYSFDVSFKLPVAPKGR